MSLDWLRICSTALDLQHHNDPNNNKPALKKGKLLVMMVANSSGKEELRMRCVRNMFSNNRVVAETFDDVKGESKVVDMAELEENDWNLNILGTFFLYWRRIR